MKYFHLSHSGDPTGWNRCNGFTVIISAEATRNPPRAICGPNGVSTIYCLLPLAQSLQQFWRSVFVPAGLSGLSRTKRRKYTAEGVLMKWALLSRYDFETLLEIEAKIFGELSHRKQQSRRQKRRRTPKTPIAGHGIAGRRNRNWNW